MDMFSWSALEMELLLEQALRPLEATRSQPVRHRPGHAGLRAALAAVLVRAGLRLDPAAVESLPALHLAPATGKGEASR